MDDGRASLPGFVRGWIAQCYPAYVLRTIDEAGALHDEEIRLFHRPKVANRVFLRRLKMVGIPWEVRLVLRVGLAVYWNSPGWLKRLWWRLVPAG